MAMTMRVSLLGYDCLTDTNLDHFALYGDQDNVLIKEFTRGGTTIAAGGTYQIAHQLGYVPYFMVFATAGTVEGNKWYLVPAYYNSGFTVPRWTATSDTGTLTITNNNGASNQFKWYVFYDNFTANAGTITPTNEGIRMSKQGIDCTTSNDPNAFIFHSDLNTFKIIKEGNGTFNYTSGTVGGTYSFAHNSGLGTPSSYALFVKFPDGKTAYIPGNGNIYSYDSNWQGNTAGIDGTNIYSYFIGTGNASLPYKYYVFETPLP